MFATPPDPLQAKQRKGKLKFVGLSLQEIFASLESFLLGFKMTSQHCIVISLLHRKNANFTTYSSLYVNNEDSWGEEGGRWKHKKHALFLLKGST